MEKFFNTMVFAAAGLALGARAEVIVAHPQEKNSGITINGERVGDVKYGDCWFLNDGVLQIGPGTFVLSGTNTSGVGRVKVVGNSDVTLRNFHMKTAKGKRQGAFTIKPGVEVNLFLEGENELESGEGHAGLTVPYTSTVFINGPGNLVAIGGDYGAGIGASTAKKWNDMRKETPENYIIGGEKAFKDEYRCGDIIINSGRVGAAGGMFSAGIGGSAPADTKVEKLSRGGTYGGWVVVHGGEVFAYGGENAAGIGGSYGACGGALQVYGGYVHAVGGKYGAGIGGGSNHDGSGDSSSGFVNVEGGKVVAKGGIGAAGIGGGCGGPLCSSTQNFFETDSKQRVSISGGQVEAIGGTFDKLGIVVGGAGIGSGAYSGLGSDAKVEISGGTVKARSCASAGNIGVGSKGRSPVNSLHATLTITGGNVDADLSNPNRNMSPMRQISNANRSLAKVTVSGLKWTGEPLKLGEFYRYDENNLHKKQMYNEYGGQDLYPNESGCVYFWLPKIDDDPYYFTLGGHEYKAVFESFTVGTADFTEEEAYKEFLRTNGTAFDGNGGEPAEQLSIYEGTAYGSFLRNPTRAAWVFTGWYTAASGGTRKLESDAPTPGETLYAHWAMNDITSRAALDYEAKPCYYEGEKWFGQTAKTHDGVDAMRSGVIGPGESTTMYMRDFYGPGRVSFWWNSCGGVNASLDFCIDGKIVARVGTSNLWKQFGADIPEGPHTISWVYAKGESGAAQDDCAYVDEFSFTPTPPGNDDFADAEGLHGHAGAVEGTTRFSTREDDEPKEDASWNNATQSVWYVWSAPEGANSATFTVKGKDYVDASHGFRPVIGVHRGEGRPDELTCVAYAADEGGTASANFDGLSAGATYHIRVSGNFGNGGNYFGDFTLEWKTSESAAAWRPQNDARAKATILVGAKGTIKESTTGASYEEDRLIDDPDPEHPELNTYEKIDLLSVFEPSATNSVWFKWEAPYTGNVAFDTFGSSFNTALGVYDAGVAVAENVNSQYTPGFSSRVYFGCVKGTVYEVCVAGVDGATGNLKLNWNATKAETIPVVFAANDGSGGASTNVYANEQIGIDGVPTPEREGYTFDGWYDAPEGGSPLAAEGFEVDVPATLYAHWTPISYDVEFDKNYEEAAANVVGRRPTYKAGGGNARQKFSYDTWSRLDANVFTRAGYAFAGWNTESDGSGDSYADEEEAYNLTATAGGVVTLYAQWKANHYTIAFEPGVNDAEGGTPSQVVAIGKVVKLNSCGFVHPSGGKFAGWRRKDTGRRYDDGVLVFNLAESGAKVVMEAVWE